MTALIASAVVSSPSRLQNRLDAALSMPARIVAEQIGRQAYAAKSRSGAPLAYRRARLVALLAAYALDETRSDATRTLRWRRLIANVYAFLTIAESRPLQKLLEENADLL